MRVLMDVDGVLGDFVGSVLSNLAMTFVDAPKIGTIGSRHLFDYLTPKQRKHAEAYLAQAGTAYAIDEYAEARELVRAIREHNKVFFVTSPWDNSPTWVFDRRRWLMERFGADSAEIVYTRSKYLVRGDVLIEDYPLQAVEWRAEWKAGVALLVQRPWNNAHPMRKFTLSELADAPFWSDPYAGIGAVRDFVRGWPNG